MHVHTELSLSLSLQMQEGAPDYADEIRQLEAEGEMPIDELLSSLPQEILEGRPMTPESIQGDKEEGKREEVMQTKEGEKGVVRKATAEAPEEVPTVKKEESVVENRRKRFVVCGILHSVASVCVIVQQVEWPHSQASL